MDYTQKKYGAHVENPESSDTLQRTPSLSLLCTSEMPEWASAPTQKTWISDQCHAGSVTVKDSNRNVSTLQIG